MKIHTDIIRIYKSIHTWVGIISGMALFIAFYAGALTTFKEPLTEWATPPLANHYLTVDIEQAASLIPRIMEAEPAAASNLRFNLHAEKRHQHPFFWVVIDEHADAHDTSSHQFFTVYPDTENQLVTEQIHPAPLAQFIDTLHRVVGLPVDTDLHRWIMGIIAALYALALVSGLIILLRILVKELFAFRLGRKPKRLWLDAHNIVGVTSLPFHIIMAVTAFVFAYHDLIYGAQNYLIHDGKLREVLYSSAPSPQPDQTTDPAHMLSPQILLERIKPLSANFTPNQIEYVNVTTPKASVRIWGNNPQAIEPRAMGGFISINPYTGDIQSTDYLPGEQDAVMLTVSSFFALHFATYGGDFVRWLYFLLGLAGAWLFYTGNLLWIETRRKRKKPHENTVTQRRDVRIMAALTVGICLGCVCGISLITAGSKWLSTQSPVSITKLQWLYYLMFFAAIGWSFLRGAARGLVDLLWLAAWLTALIPITSLVGTLLPSIGLWLHTDLSSLMVDITALLMALGFMLLARATSRRVYADKVQDSVWSYYRAQATQP